MATTLKSKRDEATAAKASSTEPAVTGAYPKP